MSTFNTYKIQIAFVLFISVFGLKEVLAEGTRINFELDTSTDTTLIIGKYLNGSIFVADSLHIDSEGVAIWKADSLIPQGLYEIVFSSDKHYPLLVGSDREFSIKISSPVGVENILIEGAKESSAYNDYQVFLQQKMKEKNALASRKRQHANQSDSIKAIQQQQRKLDEEVRSFINKEVTEYDGTLYSSVLQLAFAPPVPDFSKQAKSSLNHDSLKRVLRFNYVFEHHFDAFDAGDIRLFRTPFYKQHLDYFYTKVCPPLADSVISVSIPLIEESKRDSATFKFMINYVMNYAEKSKIMGMDAVVLKLLQTYYITDEAWWISSKQAKDAKEMEMYLRYNQIGMQAPNFTLPMWQNEGEEFSLYDLSHKYTLLIFWEPDCGHCKVFIPKLYKHLSETYPTLPFEVLAVSTVADTALHNSFIVEHELHDWLHLCNDNKNNNFKVYYDLRVVPQVYLLDENRTIVAKKLGIESIDQLINALDL